MDNTTNFVAGLVLGSALTLLSQVVVFILTKRAEWGDQRRRWKTEKYTDILSLLRPYIVPWEKTSDSVALSLAKSMNEANLVASKRVLEKLFALGTAATSTSHISDESERRKFQQHLYEPGGLFNDLIRDMRADIDPKTAKGFENFSFPLLKPPDGED
jgi:hypothetical protein